MHYIKTVFTFDEIQEYQQDLLISDLADIGFDSFEENTNGFTGFIVKESFDEVKIKALLKSYDEDFKAQYVIEEVPDENWNIEWEKNFSPLTVYDVCYVRATFHAPQPSYPYEIIIDPKMAFGTGHHQTTTMMMEYIITADVKDKTILDMGCGTGILAILASKMGAKRLTAVDYDEVCCDSTRENMALNDVQNITSICGSKEVIPKEQFEIIFANINRNILLDQISTYAEVLIPAGKIYFSGFYFEPDLEIIKDECERYGMSFIDNKQKDNWVAAQFIKNY